MLVEKIQLSSDSNVTLCAYIPDISDEMKNMKVKPAVLILPGGAYKFCSDREAEPIALMFVSKGYNAFVLRYSLNENALFPRPLNDAQKAFDLIVKNSDNWHTDKSKIAVCGFSAGGHLAAALSTMGNPKPAASILGYPCILDSTSPILAKPVPSLEKEVTPETPPTFIFAAYDDDGVPIENSLEYAMALKRNEVPLELHIFRKGGHGFSLADNVTMSNNESRKYAECTSVWADLCIDWLNDIFKVTE